MEEPAAIPAEMREQFRSLLLAVVNHELCLVSCKDCKTGAPVFVICIATVSETDGTPNLTPLARMYDTNPYLEIIPPLANSDSPIILH